jgi:hypothetical protein
MVLPLFSAVVYRTYRRRPKLLSYNLFLLVIIIIIEFMIIRYHSLFNLLLLLVLLVLFIIIECYCYVYQNPNAAVASTENIADGELRITFLVNIWLNHRPCSVNPLPNAINHALNIAAEDFLTRSGHASPSPSCELLLPSQSLTPALFTVDASAERVLLPFLEGELQVSLPFPSAAHLVSGSVSDHTLLFGFVQGNDAYLLENENDEGEEDENDEGEEAIALDEQKETPDLD